MKSIAQSVFLSADKSIQDAWISKGYQIVADEVETASSDDLFNVDKAEVTEPEVAPHNDYSIEGDRIWMNVDIVINGHKLRIPSVEITSIYYAQRKAKGQDSRIDVTEVMSLVNTIRKHGTDKVNSAIEVNVRFGMAGDKPTEAIDLLA